MVGISESATLASASAQNAKTGISTVTSRGVTRAAKSRLSTANETAAASNVTATKMNCASNAASGISAAAKHVSQMKGKSR
ncbi:MAG: hypothetical protein IPO54_05935 [Micavibrio sp.]|nr:hypothetical protein [Micavibrio sp.]